MNCLHEELELTDMVLVVLKQGRGGARHISYSYVVYKTNVISHARGHDQNCDISESVV
jgi:hypothetical protein